MSNCSQVACPRRRGLPQLDLVTVRIDAPAETAVIVFLDRPDDLRSARPDLVKSPIEIVDDQVENMNASAEGSKYAVDCGNGDQTVNAPAGILSGANITPCSSPSTPSQRAYHSRSAAASGDLKNTQAQNFRHHGPLPKAIDAAGRAPHPPALTIRRVDAGFAASFSEGRTGRRTSSPPQFGHRLCSNSTPQREQNVHSNVQIIASRDSGGRSRSQHSQFGLSSSMAAP